MRCRLPSASGDAVMSITRLGSGQSGGQRAAEGLPDGGPREASNVWDEGGRGQGYLAAKHEGGAPFSPGQRGVTRKCK